MSPVTTLVDLPLWVALPAALLIIIGALLTLLGSVGLLRFSNFYARIHAPTLGNTLGTGCILLASMLISSALAQRPIIHEVLITLFIIMTSPVTAMMLMRAAMFRDRNPT